MKKTLLICVSLLSTVVLYGCNLSNQVVKEEQVTLRPSELESIVEETKTVSDSNIETTEEDNFITQFNNTDDINEKKNLLKNTFSKNYQIVLEDKIQDIPVAKFLYRVCGDDILYEQYDIKEGTGYNLELLLSKGNDAYYYTGDLGSYNNWDLYSYLYYMESTTINVFKIFDMTDDEIEQTSMEDLAEIPVTEEEFVDYMTSDYADTYAGMFSKYGEKNIKKEGNFNKTPEEEYGLTLEEMKNVSLSSNEVIAPTKLFKHYKGFNKVHQTTYPLFIFGNYSWGVDNIELAEESREKGGKNYNIVTLAIRYKEIGDDVSYIEQDYWINEEGKCEYVSERFNGFDLSTDTSQDTKDIIFTVETLDDDAVIEIPTQFTDCKYYTKDTYNKQMELVFDNIDGMSKEDREKAHDEIIKMANYIEADSVEELLGISPDGDTGYFSTLFDKYLTSRYIYTGSQIKESDDFEYDSNTGLSENEIELYLGEDEENAEYVSTGTYEKIVDVYSKSSIAGKLKEIPY